MVTPARVLYLPPEVMMENRVVSRFTEEYALRCVFRDDDGTRLVDSKFGVGRGRGTVVLGIFFKKLCGNEEKVR